MVTAAEFNSICDSMITYHIDQTAIPLKKVERLEKSIIKCRAWLTRQAEKARLSATDSYYDVYIIARL